MNASRRIDRHQHKKARSQLCASNSYALFDLLTGQELLDEVAALLPEHRERLYGRWMVQSLRCPILKRIRTFTRKRLPGKSVLGFPNAAM